MDLDTLLAERDITRVLHRYASALDGRDWPLLASCFRPDAVITYASGPVNGYPAIEQVCRNGIEPLDASQHLIGNVEISVDDTSAQASCYFQAQHVRANTPGGDHFLLGGRYVDTLSLESGHWLIATRRLERMWADGNPGVLRAPGRDR